MGKCLHKGSFNRITAMLLAVLLFIGLLPTVSIALPEQTDSPPLLSGTDIPEPLSAEQLAQHGAVQRLRGEEPDEYTFVFLNSDGTRTSYSYGVPVKYTDENGAVRDKNNTIKDFNNEYGNLDSDVQLRFPKKLNAVKISYKNRQVQIKPITDMAPGHINAEVSGNTVTYANAFGEGMDLRYASTMNGVKEDIILRSNTGVNSFSFEVKTGGLALKELDGEWCVADGDRKIFGFGDLDVTDSFTGEDEATDDWDAHSTTASISVQTVQENKKYVVTLSVDEAFLNAPTTVYPVYVDPSFNVESSYIQDTYISQGSPNANYGTGKDLKLGYGASSKSNRVLVRFSNFVNNVSRPGLDSTTIVSAKYYMYCTTTYTSTPYVDAYMIALNAADWTDTGATWNNAAASTLNSAVLNGSTKVGSAGWYNFNVTNAYKAWWQTFTSRGLLFKMRIESATENYYRHFASANYTADSKKLPYLAVQYGAEGMLISPTSADMTVGQTKQISASIYPTSIDQQVTWTSSNPDVAEVSSSGLVTAKKTGSTTITAKAVKNSAISATCNIRVIVPVTQVILNRYNRIMGVGDTYNLVASVRPIENTVTGIMWSSSNTNVATVSAGKVTAISTGTATITAKSVQSGVEAKCLITVNNLKNVYIRVLYDNSFYNTFGNQSEMVIAQLMDRAKIPYLRKWNINLIAEPTRLSTIYAQDLSANTCTWVSGGNNCVNTGCGHACEHSSGISVCKCGYTAYDIITSLDFRNDERGYDMQTCFFTFDSCVGGLAGVNGNYSVVQISPISDVTSETFMGSVRRVQHEISHNFGTTHNGSHTGVEKYCTEGSHCINNSGLDHFSQINQDDVYDLETIWCDVCAGEFKANKFD